MTTIRWRTVVVAVGLALAIVGAIAGSRYGLSSASRHLVELAAERAAFATLTNGFHCARVKGDAWSPLPGLEYTGRLVVTLPGVSGGEMVMIVGDEFPLEVDVETMTGIEVPVKKTRLVLGPGGVAPPPDYWLEEGSPLSAPPEVQRLTIPASAGSDRLVSLRLGRRAPRVLARLAGYPSEARATICAASLELPPAFQGAAEITIAPQSASTFGIGWLGLEDLPDVGRIRFMRHYGAVLIASAARRAVHVALEGRLGVIRGAIDPAVELSVNGVVSLDARPLRNGTAVYEWDVPERAWLQGINELLFRVSGAPLGLQRLTLTLSTGLP